MADQTQTVEEAKNKNLPVQAEKANPEPAGKVITGAAHSTETPDWLKEAGSAPLEAQKDASNSSNESADVKTAQAESVAPNSSPAPVNLREEKPDATSLGEDPNSDVVVSKGDEDLVAKYEHEAAEKMKEIGLDPSTGKPLEQPQADSGVPVAAPSAAPAKAEKKSFIDNLKWIFTPKKKNIEAKPGDEKTAAKTTAAAKVASGKSTQNGLSEEERKKLIEAEKIYQEGLASIKDLIAPASMEIKYDRMRIDGMWVQSFYVFSYPRYLDVNWLAPIVNFDVTMDISQFIYPISSGQIMKTLKRKVAQMQSSMRINAEKGRVRDPALETALQDAEQLRTEIQRGQEKFFQFALYFTLYSDDEKKLDKAAKQLESLLAGKLVMTKRAQIQAEHGFNACLPLCLDELYTIRNMNTGPLSTTFPFTSSDLTSDKGILYGINRHNDSLIIFDRFALENANSVVFAKSGAGKSYAVKLEILRLMMMGTDMIVIDPENEYEALANTVGGSYLRLSLNSDRRINPFDLPSPVAGDDAQPGDLLRSAIINLHGLLKLMLGDLSPEEESVLDRALIDVYALKGITMDILDPSVYEPPTMEDLHQVLASMEGAGSLVQRISKYTEGSYSGIFNKPTNIDLSTGMMVFCIRDLEDALRPTAMYIILNYIWNRVRSEMKKRILVIDEAWSMMQHEDSAKFLFGLVKRARKYYLGVTTITQDVEDFVKSDYGKPIITNSSMQLLLKQAPSAVDMLGKIFNLTEGEKYVLLNSGVGQGLFFAGLKHVAVQIIASYTEDKIITTNPEELLKAKDDVAEVADSGVAGTEEAAA